MTTEEILLFLYRDTDFRPSHSSKTRKIIDEAGNEIEVPVSYYYRLTHGATISVRVSDHGTHLKTWLNRSIVPNITLQNLSVVFSDIPVEYKLGTEKINGGYLYFVVEQYVYLPSKLTINDFKKIIKRIKNTCATVVFRDPLRKSANKKASRTVLTPTDMDGNKIPPSTNTVTQRQTVVADNPDYEVDAKSKVLKESDLRRIIRESIYRVLRG